MIRRLARLCLATAMSMAGVVSLAPPPAAAAAFSDIGSSAFRAEIEWLAERGITGGCGPGRFCPINVVTREQMASFLVRMFALPPSGDDRFGDDAGSDHQADINALAAAGITGGCRTDAFCPRAVVTREQMASFLARAASLPPSGSDYFLDDERSSHEPDINRSAAAGITGGCGSYRYCPRSTVTREQMAGFLYRIEAPKRPPTPLPDVGPLPICRYDDVLTARRALDDWSTSLLDTIYMLPADYYPGDLVSTSTAGANAGHSIRRLVVSDLAALVSAARGAGRPISIVSAFRSYATQETTFAQNVAKYGREIALRRSARPGHSEHQLGTTIDVTHAGGAAAWTYRDWATHPTGAWMRDNAWRYGFVVSYPKESFATVCYDYEPWHFRYVGRAMAADVRATGLTLREFIWRVHGP
ncbi:MAG: D-alanyl-D-alanine carboxypeptidase family protein [Candidatus Limnocylindria bacterium]